MLESMTTHEVDYVKLSPEEQKKRGILGRLVGPIADFKRATRNGRKYGEELWENVFNSDLMKEKIATKTLFGELGHPADRTETDMSKVAICLAEVPKKGKDGCLHGVFDILDTPCGRILKTLCDYGATIGVSSRGEGDVETDFNGQESVNPDTYDCEGWDAVVTPSVKAARMEYIPVMESLSSGKKLSLKESLNKLVEEASEDDKKVMEKAIDDLHLEDDEENQQHEKTDELIKEEQKQDAAEDVGANADELQEALNKLQTLEDKVMELQEKLSVCYTKEAKQEDTISKLNEAVKTTSIVANKAKMLEKRVSELNEELSKSLQQCKQLNENYSTTCKINDLSNDKVQKLTEECNKRIAENFKLSEDLKASDDKNKKLIEQFNEEKQKYTNKLESCNKLVEKYKGIANKAVDHYIDSQAIKLGCSSNEIKNKLPESYNFNDIDAACEDVSSYKLGMSKLPFRSAKLNESVQMKARPSKSPSSELGQLELDDVDDSLLSLAKLN